MSSVVVRSIAAAHNADADAAGPDPLVHLDSDMRHVLDVWAGLGPKPIEQCTVPEARAQPTLAMALAKIVRDLPDDGGISMELRMIPGAAGEIKARVYAPAGEAAGLPMILYLHGGGWVLGDLDHSDALCRRLALETGYVVANVDYRLAPEHRYPTAAEDSFAAFSWVVREADALGVDPGRIAVAGASAGGNLAAAVALMARDRGGVQPAAQLLAYPVLDDACDSGSFRDFGEGYIVNTDDMRWYWTQYLARPEDAAQAYACPLKADDLAGLPPALVITAECDPIRDDGERYAERLSAAGVRATVSRYPGALHGFFAMPGVLSKGTQAVLEASDFLKRRLGG